MALTIACSGRASRAAACRALAALKFVTLALLVGTASAQACPLSADEVYSRVAAGEAAVVVKETSSDACMSMIAARIASGSASWIGVAQGLRGHTDAAYGETVLDALGQAMQRAPSRVLPLVGEYRPEQICLPWMLDDSGASDELYRAVIRRARFMFEAFLETSLRDQADACLAIVRAADEARRDQSLLPEAAVR